MLLLSLLGDGEAAPVPFYVPPRRRRRSLAPVARGRNHLNCAPSSILRRSPTDADLKLNLKS
jgi:hypothetical protein